MQKYIRSKTPNNKYAMEKFKWYLKRDKSQSPNPFSIEI